MHVLAPLVDLDPQRRLPALTTVRQDFTEVGRQSLQGHPRSAADPVNAQFEGNAGGELFNCGGKTDILIPEKNANVFIGECKIFGSKDRPGKITDTINQLLGYLTWRDTKAALLLFIRDRDVTNVISKAIAAFEAHPNFKRRGATSTSEPT